ncbi:MAG: DNA primase [Clostridia bacterium]|nr:DNA primase [Clostridia bacterium]
MVQYSNELKEEIRAANDIVDVISQYVTLKRSGRNYFGICPFHREKSPSFSVSPDRQYFHCFGCHKGGDVFTFISEIEKLSFKETIEFLAERGHVTLPIEQDEGFNEKQYLKDRMYKVNLETTLFFHERLYQPLAKIAQNYVKERKLDNNTLKAFKIGYSGEYNELYKHLKSQGFKDNEILATGLVNKNDRGEFIDRFRKRLMFPIMSVNGKVVAFGGRRLDNNEKSAKYINSNENLVYSKKQHLFALNLAKQTNSKQIILVEGYMDAISLYQRGIQNVVASLGTALTEEQGRLLRKYSEQVLMSYDSDGAGQEAIMRGLEILGTQGCDARVIQMEGAKDPDEYVIKYGSERFNLLAKNAISLVEFKVKMLKSNYNLENATDKVRFLKEITKILSQVENKIEQEIYIDKISKQYVISKEAIYAEVNKQAYKNQSSKDNNILNRPVHKEVKVKEEISEAIIKRENMILYLLINHYEESVVDITSNILKEDFKLEVNQKIFEAITNSKEKSKERILQVLSNIEDSDLQSQISEIMLSDYEITSVQKCIEDIIIIYTKERLNNRKLAIIKELENSNLPNEEVSRLEVELNNIIIELAKM